MKRGSRACGRIARQPHPAYQTAMDQLEPLAEIVHQTVVFTEGLTLDCGRSLARLTVAYRTYGTLDPVAGNAPAA